MFMKRQFSVWCEKGEGVSAFTRLSASILLRGLLAVKFNPRQPFGVVGALLYIHETNYLPMEGDQPSSYAN